MIGKGEEDGGKPHEEEDDRTIVVPGHQNLGSLQLPVRDFLALFVVNVFRLWAEKESKIPQQ